MNEVILRPVRPESDVKFLSAIYAPYVEQLAVSFETVTPSAEEFQQRIRHTLEAGYPYIVAEIGGEVVGYTYAGIFKPRAAYCYSVEETIYVKQGCHHQGIGRLLLTALEDALRAKGIYNSYAIITYPREGNDPHLTKDSVLFHEKMGYKTVAHLSKCGYKFGRWYDVVFMEHLLGDHPAQPEPVK